MKHQKLITTAIIWALVSLVSITDTPTLWWNFLWHCPCKWVGSNAWLVSSPTWSDLYVIVCGIGGRESWIWLDQSPLDAKRQLAESVQSLVSSGVEIQRETLTETNETFTDAFEATSLSVVENVNISGYEVLDQAAERSGNKYSFYILVQFPRENVETKLIEPSSPTLCFQAMNWWKMR